MSFLGRYVGTVRLTYEILFSYWLLSARMVFGSEYLRTVAVLRAGKITMSRSLFTISMRGLILGSPIQSSVRRDGQSIPCCCFERPWLLINSCPMGKGATLRGNPQTPIARHAQKLKI